MLNIELNELFDYRDTFHTAEPEHEARITVAELLRHIDVPDDWDIGFGGTTDASLLGSALINPPSSKSRAFLAGKEQGKNWAKLY